MSKALHPHLLSEIRAINDGKRPMTFPEAREFAKEQFKIPGTASVNTVCIRACGMVEVVQFGPKGGHKTIKKVGPL